MSKGYPLLNSMQFFDFEKFATKKTYEAPTFNVKFDTFRTILKHLL